MIHYLKGDATQPQGEGGKIIAHICNDVGGWGAGFVVAISRRWPEPEAAYRAWARGEERTGGLHIGSKTFALGNTQFVSIGPKLAVANMIAQRGYGPRGNAPHRTEDDDPSQPPIRYEALALCLKTVSHVAGHLAASVHMPRIGTGLAGGKWERIEPIITSMLGEREVFVYDLEVKRAV